ncbi:LysE family translocator [Psychromonas aquimarina]|uniref:LysE family translocator n=1 Tax=Psychromonas aquimarina TaxID=444919 RepID=UPI0004133133|nr:LysE family translocator [Psychromonas aquimarina]
MHILNFEAFLIAITLLTLTPGLDTALVVRNSSRSGGVDGCITSLGICLGLFVHALFSAVGISAILLQSAELFQIMKWIGAGYLIWLGVNSIKASIKGINSMETAVNQTVVFDAGRSIREGFLSNVLNPKTAVFYLAFLPQFIDPAHSAFTQSLSMAAVHFVIAMLWQCGLAGAVNSAKKLFQSSSAMAWMEGLTGTVLIFLAVKLLSSERSL